MNTYKNEEIIKVTENNDFAKIEILNNCSLMYFYNELSKKLSDKKFKLVNINCIFSENNVAKRILYIITKDNRVYNIATKINSETTSKEDLKTPSKYINTSISEKRFTKDEIEETTLTLLPKDNYYMKTSTSYPNGIIKNIHLYEKNGNYDIPSFRKLSRKKAIKKIRELIINLEEIKDIDKIIDTNTLENHLNIISSKNYNKVISDDAITLSKKVSNNYEEKFDIILNKTMEKIGDISIYNTYDLCDFYNGNIGYEIYEEYRNKHFATRALNLLKNYLKEIGKEQDLYISTNKDNIYSQKVALNNNGELFYDGKIPYDKDITPPDDVKHVKIYKINK